MHVSILCQLDPIGELVSLDTLLGPEGPALTLNDVELPIEAECHQRMTGVRPSAVHDG